MTLRSEETLTIVAERPQAIRELPVGTRVGGYLVEEAKAEGGFATVYRARSMATGEDVALKILHPDVALSGIAVLRLKQEAEVLSRAAHPNIVQTFEVGELTLEQPYLVMEWLGGHTLSEELKRRGTFSLVELLGIMEQLCAGLGAAHEAGVIHRDLKASNVMVLPKDGWFELKLVDFGIAKVTDVEPSAHSHSLTTSGVTLGTPHYMAPEQVLGQAVDARVDIYALGVLSYLLLSGRFPFHAESPVEIQEMHLYGAPPKLGDLVAIPADVEAVIHRCLEKRREARYESARELLEELRRAIKGPDDPSSAEDEARPSGAASREVMGLYFAVSFDGADEELDDDALSAIEEVLDGARDACEKEGLSLAFEGTSAWLAARGAEDPAARRELIDLALRLRDRWVGHHPKVRVAIALHAEPSRGRGSGELLLASGEPFLPGDWTSGLVPDAIIASEDALSLAEESFELERVAGAARSIIRRRRRGSGAAEGGACA